MDIISFNEAATANGRIEKFIKNPDSTSGIVTVPKTIASGETITIPDGRVAVLPNITVDGTLNVEGEVFIPSGATMSKVVEKVTSTDNAIVRFNGTTGAVQNSGVIIDDYNNVTTAGYVKSGYSQITGSGFTGTFAADATGIYTDVGNTNYRIWAGGAERMRIDVNGNVGIGVTPFLNAHATSVGNYIFTINKNIPISGIDYKHKYLILTKVPSYGAVAEYVSLKGKYIAERGNSNVGVNIDINFSIGYGNQILFDSTKLGNSNDVELVQVSYNGNQYLALYWYSAPNAMSSKFIGELTNYDYKNQITTDFLTHYETDSAIHSSIGYNRQGIALNGNMTLDSAGNVLIGTSTNNGVDKLQVNGSVTSISSHWKYSDLNNACTVDENTVVNNYCLNIPYNDYGYVTIQVSAPYLYCMQTFVGLNAPARFFVRVMAGGNWSAWVEK